jgi:hypothetical protein
MKKAIIAIIVLVLLISAGILYFTYKKQSDVKKAPGQTAITNVSNNGTGTEPKQEAQKKGIELQGKALGIGTKELIVARPEGGVETFNISLETPVFEADGQTKSGLGVIQPGKTIKVSYDDATKNAISIIILEK